MRPGPRGPPLTRRAFRGWLRRRLASRAEPIPEEEFSAPTVVVSPHFDDEVLGCGGTVLLRTAAGAAVDLVFMTDGAASHGHAMEGRSLSALRGAEGRAAAAELGVAPERVHLLGFPETRLAEHAEPAEDRLAELLAATRPRCLYLPHRAEPRLWSDDHRTTSRAGFAAARRSGLALTVYEYPVWIWRQWPFTPYGGPGTERRAYLRQTAASLAGWRTVRALDCSVVVEDVLARKRAALERHASQVSGRPGAVPWPTLGDVGGGEFLDCFFQSHEFFRCSRLPAGGG